MMKKKVLLGILLFTLCITNLTGCQIGNTEYVLSTSTINKKTVFTINEQACSVEEYKLYLANYKNLYGNAYGVDLWNYDFGEDSLHQYTKDVALSELSRIVCMDLLAEEKEIQLTDEEITLATKAAEEYFNSLTDDEKAFIGASKEGILTCYEHYALAKKLYDELTSGVNEEVSDDEARVIRVQQIYVTNQNNAQEVENRLNSGEDFVTVANTYNEAENVETTVARGEYPDEVEEILFNLDNDGYSGKITVDGGYYFFKCLNKLEVELTQQNKGAILIEREKKDFDDGYKAFVNQAVVELNKDLWKKIDVNSEKEITTDSFFTTYDKFFP